MRWKIFLAAMCMSPLSAIEMDDLSLFQKLPKSELHLHLGGSFPLPYLLSLATAEQAEKLQNSLQLVSNKIAYQEVFNVFQVISQIVNTEERLQKGVEELCDALQKDGVVYAEIRTGLKDLGNGPEEYLKAILRGINSKSTNNFSARVLLSLQRNSSPQTAKMSVDLALKYQSQGVVGIDLSGNSTFGQLEPIVPEFVRAKKEGLALVAHLGEAPSEQDQLLILQVLQPDRIGHGVYLSEEAKKWILERRIPIEICLTSSVLVQMIDRYENHPGLAYFRQGHPILFCTDDPLLFSTTLSQELSLAHSHANISIEEIEKIVQDSSKYHLKSENRN